MRIVERLTARQHFLEMRLADIVHDTSEATLPLASAPLVALARGCAGGVAAGRIDDPQIARGAVVAPVIRHSARRHTPQP